MSGTRRRAVVVGASLAGSRAVRGLRDAGFDGPVTLVGAEPHAPYDRPPLSKEFLAGQVGLNDITLLDETLLRELDVEVRYGSPATALRVEERTVELGDGSRLPYDSVVVATGLKALMPAAWGALEGVHGIRTVEDATAVRDELRTAARLVVIGGGFIGCEVAAQARQLGLDVTVIDQMAGPLIRALGPLAAEVAAALHRDAGIRLLMGRCVLELQGGSRVERVVLADGTALDADLVVVGIGAAPDTRWLAGSGLRLDDGIVCDSRCAAGPPGVYAAGDIARWHNPLFGESMRVEHWTNASEMGTAAGRGAALGDAAREFASVPYAWSDQHGLRIEVAGLPLPGDDVRVIEGDPAQHRFVALHGRAGRLAAVVGFGSRRTVLRYRRMLLTGTSMKDAVTGTEPVTVTPR
jgi:NADPH-dependent 2,4-dienoyl-CoA reductase/sulfur reductase-like enzyme